MIKVRGIDPQRVKAIDGGYKDDLTVYLHLIPVGAEFVFDVRGDLIEVFRMACISSG